MHIGPLDDGVTVVRSFSNIGWAVPKDARPNEPVDAIRLCLYAKYEWESYENNVYMIRVTDALTNEANLAKLTMHHMMKKIANIDT